MYEHDRPRQKFGRGPTGRLDVSVSRDPERGRTRSHAWWLVAVAWVAVVVAMWDYRPAPGLATDAQAYHLAAESVREGGRLYEPLPPPGPHIVGIYPYYLYPPPFASLLSLVPLDEVANYRLMLVLATIGIGALSFGVGRLWQLDPRIIAGLLLAFPGSVGLVMTGNIQSLVDGMAVAALVLPAGTATLLLVSATALKVTPMWALVVVVVRSRTWVTLLCASAAWAAVMIAALGIGPAIEACLVWIRDVAPTLAQGQFLAGESWLQWNVSPVFAPLHVLDPWSEGRTLPVWARAYLSAVQLGVPLATLWSTRRLPWQEQAGWVIVGATLAAPILRPGYFPVLLLVPALLHRAARRRAGDRADDGLADPA